MLPQAKITAVLTARPGQAEALKTLLLAMAPHCRAEPGNLRWDVWQDQSRADRYVIDELYVNDAAVAAHRVTDHYKAYLSQIPDLADRSAVVLTPVDVAQTRP